MTYQIMTCCDYLSCERHKLNSLKQREVELQLAWLILLLYSPKELPIPAIKEINYNWYRNLFG